MNNRFIGSRIAQILRQKGYAQRDLAAAVGVHVNVVSCWCRSVRFPNIDQLVEIASFLNVSTDYLLGLTNLESNDQDFLALCSKTGLTETSADNLIKITKSHEDSEREDSDALNAFLSSWNGISRLVSALSEVKRSCEEARLFLGEVDLATSRWAIEYRVGKTIDRMELSFFKADEAFRNAIDKAFNYRKVIEELHNI